MFGRGGASSPGELHCFNRHGVLHQQVPATNSPSLGRRECGQGLEEGTKRCHKSFNVRIFEEFFSHMENPP